MMKKSLLLISVLFACFSVSAQLNGTKTIGGTGADYPNLIQAVSALSSQGVNGAVVFNIAPGTYAGKVNISAISGVSATNTITFQSANGDSSSVIITDTSTVSSTNNYTLRLNNSSRIVFNKVSLRRTGANDNARVIEISGTSNFISFTNCRIEGQSTTSLDDNKTLVHAAVNNNNTNIQFHRNVFLDGNYGLYLQGQGSGVGFMHTGNKITGNVFTNQYYVSLRLAYQDSPEFKDNTVVSNSTYHSYWALYAFYSTNATVITGNKISIMGGRGIYMHNSNGSAVSRGLIANNFIAHGGAAGIALVFENSHSHNVYYNNMNAYGVSNAVRLIQIAGATTSLLHIANNSLVSAGSGYVYYVDPNTGTPISTCNFNNVKSNSGDFAFFKSTGNLASLSAWTSATTFDASSISVNPGYVSNTDLHVTLDSLDKKATISLLPPLVSTDIDGNPRSSTQPDIGAHEVNYDNIGVISVNLNKTSACEGDVVCVGLHIYNFSAFRFNGSFTAGFQIPGTGILRNHSFNNVVILPGDTLFHYFTVCDTLYQAGIYQIMGFTSLANDINKANDTSFASIQVHAYPQVSLGNDTLLCGHHTITLTAPAGAGSYLWSTGDTTAQITLDTLKIGYGLTNIVVTLSNNGCSASDSVNVTFVNCTSVEDNFKQEIRAVVLPNPLTSESVLRLQDSYPAGLELRIYDAYGRLVVNDRLYGTTHDLGGYSLRSGVYLLYLYSADSKGVLRLMVR